MRKIPWAVVGVVLIALYNVYCAIRGVNDLTSTEAWVLTIVGVLLAGFAGWQVWDQQNSNTKLIDLIEDMARTLGIQTSKEKIQNVTYFATPLTLRNLFDSDFPYAGKFGAFQTKDEATGKRRPSADSTNADSLEGLRSLLTEGSGQNNSKCEDPLLFL